MAARGKVVGMRKVIVLAGLLSLAPLLGGCLSNGSGADPGLSSEKSGSYEERSKCQDTSEGGEGKHVCY